MAEAEPDDEVAAFARAFGPICRIWPWCVFLSGVPLAGGLLAIVLLYRLERLWRTTEGVVATYLGICVGLAGLAVGALAVGTAFAPSLVDSPAPGVALGCGAVGLLLFCRGMQPWLRVYDQRQELLARWRRSEIWAWVGLGGAVVAGIVALSGNDTAGPEYHFGDRQYFAPLVLVWAVVFFGPLLSVRASAAATKDSLNAYLASLSPRTTSTT
jgi:hypothetical protein